MHMISTQMSMLCQVGLFQDIQRYQCGKPLTIRRNFEQLVTSINGADRFYPFRFMIGQVVMGPGTVERITETNDFISYFACVESVAAACSDNFQ